MYIFQSSRIHSISILLPERRTKRSKTNDGPSGRVSELYINIISIVRMEFLMLEWLSLDERMIDHSDESGEKASNKTSTN